ncbi:MAG: hypothetical protein R3C15_19605 [Thermoleophilia bacterium]
MQFKTSLVETETATPTAVGDRDHLIHRLRTNDPGDADSPGSATLIEFTDSASPSTSTGRIPAASSTGASLAGLIELAGSALRRLAHRPGRDRDGHRRTRDRTNASPAASTKDLGLDTEDIQAAFEELMHAQPRRPRTPPYVATSPATDTAPQSNPPRRHEPRAGMQSRSR